MGFNLIITGRLYAYICMLVVVMDSLLAVGIACSGTLAIAMAAVHPLPYFGNYFRCRLCVIARNIVFTSADTFKLLA